MSGTGAIRSCVCHCWGTREDGKIRMNGRNGFTDNNAREPLQRLSGAEIGAILRGMATDQVRHANQLGSLARMMERYDHTPGLVHVNETAQRVLRDALGEGEDRKSGE